jgi:hypothetical protein
MKKSSLVVALICIIFIIVLLIQTGFIKLEVIPETAKPTIIFNPEYVEIQPGETLVVEIKNTPFHNVEPINYFFFIKLPWFMHNTENGEWTSGISYVLTNDESQWEYKGDASPYDRLIRSSDLPYEANVPIHSHTYLMVKPKNMATRFTLSDINFDAEGLESYKIRTDGSIETLNKPVSFIIGDAEPDWHMFKAKEENLLLKKSHYPCYAIEFKIPEDTTFNKLGRAIISEAYYCDYSYGHEWYTTWIGYSRTMTMDENQWEYKCDAHGTDTYIPPDAMYHTWCSPGETYYLMIKPSDNLRKYCQAVDTSVHPNVKCYVWTGSSFIEIDKIPCYAIYTAVDEPFYVDFKWSPTYPEPGEVIQFTDTSHQDLIVEWQWAFESEQYSYEQNPTYTYTEEGNYTVTLTGTSVYGTPIEINKQIRVGYDIPEPSEEEFDWWILGLIGLIGLFGLVAFKRKKIF